MSSASNKEICSWYEEVENEKEAGELHEKIFRLTSFIPEHLAYKYRKFSFYADLLQIGKMALFAAIRCFDPEKCPNFYGWAYPWVKKSVGMAAFRQKQYAEIFDFSSNWDRLSQEVVGEQDPEEILFGKELSVVLFKASGKTGRDPSYIINSLYGLGDYAKKSISVIGDKRSLSRHRVRKLRDRALAQMRRDPELIGAIPWQ